MRATTASGAAALDHLVIAAATLEQGEDFVEEKLGVRPVRGGRHATMGTHNALLRLGPREYLEIIAIDPHGAAPARPRWFGLDTPVLRATLRAQPRLLHWVVRTADIDAEQGRFAAEIGSVHAMSRGDFRWRMTIPDDGQLPGDGLIPTLIQWHDARHPAEALPPSSVEVITLAGAHPQPDRIRGVLARLGLSEVLKVTYDAAPRLAIMVRTPRGSVTL